MHRTLAAVFAFVTLIAATRPAPALAQTDTSSAPQRTGEQIRASYEAHKGDFDYLLGDWEFTGTNHDYGAIHGYWSAMRLPEGQILDEYRVVGPKGETYYVTTTLRAYNGVRELWELVTADTGAGLRDLGTGRREGAEMHLEQKFGTNTPKPALWRIRYRDIQSDRFVWSADVSHDEGKTWMTGFQKLDVRRIGPPRSMDSLAPARNAHE